MGLSTSREFWTIQILMILLTATGFYGYPFPRQAKLVDNTEYDFILVGGGTAGNVIATRLTQNSNNSVLMIEEGGDPPFYALLAEMYDLIPHTKADYNYTSTPERVAAAGQGGRTMITAGRMLGGSASLNHYHYLRGTSSDYDCWAKISGDNSWKHKNILPYYLKAERLKDTEINRQYSGYHGTEGPLGIARYPFGDESADYLNSFKEMGQPIVIDLTSNVTIGYTEPIYTVANKLRQTPVISYLKSVKDCNNLYVSKNTRVIKIIIENNVAVAVQAVYKGVTYTFRANKEVIMCAGVFNTPQLLMLSGIGPEEHLKAMKIDVKANLPVGNKLRDHVAVSLVHKVKPYSLPLPALSALLLDPTAIPFPNIIGSVALNKSQSYPDYQTYNFILQHDTSYLTIVCKAFFGYRDDICNRLETQIKSRDSLYTTLALMKPRSTGMVRLKSSDPLDDPAITTNYYKYDEDLEDMLKYVKDFINVGDTSYFKRIGAELVGLDIPDCANQKVGSDDYWRCYILTMSCSAYDFSGTCAMGSVVDGKLRVKGIERLRVADASVIPTSLRGRINAAVIMIAEKASDMILKDNA